MKKKKKEKKNCQHPIAIRVCAKATHIGEEERSACVFAWSSWSYTNGKKTNRSIVPRGESIVVLAEPVLFEVGKKMLARGWGRIGREEIVAAVNSLWWPIQGKPWRGSLSRPQTHPSTAESYDWRIVLARGGELRDRTAISIPLVPFLYCCLLRSRFARLSTVVLEIFYILVKSSELF